MSVKNDPPQDKITIKITEGVPGELVQAYAQEEKAEFFLYGALGGAAVGIVLAFSLLCGMASCAKPINKPPAVQKK